jgi:hypothetical protein
MNELWQELWKESKDSSNILIQDYPPENNLLDNLILISLISVPGLAISTKNWNPNPQPDYQSFPIGSRITYQFDLRNSGYLIVTEKFASGEIYCLAPSKLSPAFRVSWGRLILPKDDLFTVQRPTGYEEIIAVLSQDKPQLNWLPQAQDNPLELQTEHLVGLLNHINQNKCEVMRYKYLITS